LQPNQQQQHLQKPFPLSLKYSKEYRIVLFIFMTMENFPINADDITHLQTLSKDYVLRLQRNASMYIQGVPGGKVNILGGHSMGHSKQKTLFEHVSYSERFPR
jgi:hypothetical protein